RLLSELTPGTYRPTAVLSSSAPASFLTLRPLARTTPQPAVVRAPRADQISYPLKVIAHVHFVRPTCINSTTATYDFVQRRRPPRDDRRAVNRPSLLPFQSAENVCLSVGPVRV